MKRFWIIVIATLVMFLLVNLICDCFFKQGLRRYYCLYPADVLVIGHSMSEMGIDRESLEDKTGKRIAKYCMNGAGTADRLVMIRHYIEATGHKPAIVLYDVSGRSFSGGLASNSYTLFYPFMNESPTAADYVKQHATDRDFWCKRLIPLTRYDDTRLGAILRGYRGDWKNRSLKQFDTEEFKRKLSQGDFWKISMDSENMRFFDETLSFLNEQGIQCILLGLPCVDLLNQAETDKYAQAMAFIQDEVEKYPLVSFHDLNSEYSNKYELFGDPIHLNPTGQKVVTSAVADILKAH